MCSQQRLVRWLAVAVGLTAGTALNSGAGWAQAQTSVHEVQPGETIADIAQANGLSSVTLMAANSVSDPDLVRVGQQLVIPPRDGVLHAVQPGETLSGIASAFGVPTADLVDANRLQGSADALSVGDKLLVPGLDLAVRAAREVVAHQDVATVTLSPRASAPVPTQDTSTPSDPPGTYSVRDGDTLRSIAEQFHIDILALVAINSIDDPDLIRPGVRLTVNSKPREYVVQAGDTLGDIAWQYSVGGDVLLRANGLVDPDRLVVGMTLVIPASSSGPAAPSRPAPPRAPASAPAPPAPAPAPPAPAPAPPTAGAVTSARVTGYAIGAGAVSSRTASGTTTHWGTVAADTRVFPFGTRLRIEGLGDTVFGVEDTGSAVRGNVIDVWYPDAASARRLGASIRQVTIVGD